MFDISLLRKVLVYIQSGENKGSGWIVSSIESGKFYCLTAQHCVDNKSMDLFMIDNSENEIPLNYRDVITDDKNDIAIIDVEYPFKEYPLDHIFIGKINTLYHTGGLAGFPISRNGDLAVYTVKFQRVDPCNYKISICLDNANTSKELLYSQIKGISGGGIFAVEPDHEYKLLGIETEMADNLDTFNEVMGTSVEAFNTLLHENNWPLLSRSRYYYSGASWNEGRNVLVIKKEKYNINNDWVGTKAATTIIKDVQLSLLEKQETPLLICGYSGIGKTRTVLEACIQNPELSNTILFNGYDDFLHFFNYKLREYCSSATEEPIYLIVDDINLDEWNELARKIRSYTNIRAVAIAEMGSRQIQSAHRYIIQMIPNDEADVIKIVKNVCPSLSEPELQTIYRLSSNDLRFALLIAEYYSNFEDKHMWLIDHSALSIVERIMKQVVKVDNENYVAIIEIFSLFVDFGYQGNAADEVEFIAKYFNINKSLILRAINFCIDHHLGINKGNYFELSPRAMARLLFSKYYLDLIKDFSEFINQIPNEELRRRFIMRAQECDEQTWKEVQDALASCFQRKYGNAVFLSVQLHGIDILKLSSGSIKEAMTYVEFMPESGLLWMRNLINGAGNKALKNFSGMSRREIIWTCERLACFQENFYICEEILYILSQHETEEGISNNSRGVWSALFGLGLANTEVSFQDRFNHLLSRMRSYKGQDEDLFIAAINCALSIEGVRILPPKMVGGRMTPECWSEKNIQSFDDEIKIYFWILTKLKENVVAMSPTIRQVVFQCLKGKMHDFVSPVISQFNPDLLNHYFVTLECFSQGVDQHTEIVIAINKQVEYERLLQERHKEKLEIPQRINYLIQKRKQFEDTDFISRLKICLSENIYLNNNAQTEKIKDLAQELLSDNNALQIFDQILSIDNIKDHLYIFFAEILGELDFDYKFIQKINNNFITGNNYFSEYYYLGLYNRIKKLPDFIVQELEKSISENPFGVLKISVLCDFTDTGRKRILKLLQKGIVNNSILGLGEKNWATILSIKDMKEILNILIKNGTTNGAYYFFQLGRLWLRNFQSDKLVDSLFQCMADLPKAVYRHHTLEFIRLMESMPPQFTHKCITLVIQSIDFSSSIDNQYYQIDFIKKHAKGPYAKEIAYEVCSCLEAQSEHTQSGFSFSLLINMLSAQAILQWIRIKGNKRAELIAYHLPSPSLEKQFIPEVTLIVLKEYGNDKEVLNRFLSGSHALKVYNLNEVAHTSTTTLKVLEAYKNDSLMAICQWAEYERNWINGILKQKQEFDAKEGRFRDDEIL